MRTSNAAQEKIDSKCRELERAVQHYLTHLQDWRDRRVYSSWENEKRDTARNRSFSRVEWIAKEIRELKSKEQTNENQ